MDLETANKARDLLIRVQMLESRVGTLKSALSDGRFRYALDIYNEHGFKIEGLILSKEAGTLRVQSLIYEAESDLKKAIQELEGL